MKITCNREKFAAKFNLAAAYVAAREVKSILQEVKMDVKADHVVFSATDTETSIRIVLRDLEIESEGEVIIPSRLMKNILQAAKADYCDVTLTYNADDGIFGMVVDRLGNLVKKLGKKLKAK